MKKARLARITEHHGIQSRLFRGLHMETKIPSVSWRKKKFWQDNTRYVNLSAELSVLHCKDLEKYLLPGYFRNVLPTVISVCTGNYWSVFLNLIPKPETYTIVIPWLAILQIEKCKDLSDLLWWSLQILSVIHTNARLGIIRLCS